ncbi:translation initiation factor IF-2 subunit beta [Methanotrichaceae archaeon M04Ac]|jgi:translation initiation factor 2 subunit 2|uniref:Translation initiation factor 2 subunit beta n=1 Tax=Candidatus Methanocrinis alkalitolerans TaxID=3033395 RepID=A0ABT5XFC7_9EURY|nr:translation initiation factor IF-2 subunit beta [Candidatus Methanocrinis alkalitolerans]MCR3883004.1 translation initiation factor IF-2 subunit beta [Methanothrix sp.]MDF0593414.1 translation initiation factor IF-2 subunit beta [Candidatus Methanocrinis alkalitolerans]
MEDYMKGLERAISRLPASRGTEDRFVIPPPKIFYEGKTTVLENFAGIADALNRDPDHLMKFILQEMGTAGKIEGQHAVFQGRFTEQNLERHIDSYVQEYVICSECHRPDTQLIRSDRVLMLKCEACGAHRPVRKRKTKTVVPRDVIEEGETYELRIDSVGRKGDGIARVDKFMIFVPGTAKGDIVRAKIKKISGTLAFSEIVEKKGSS